MSISSLFSMACPWGVRVVGLCDDTRFCGGRKGVSKEPDTVKNEKKHTIFCSEL